MLEVAEKEKVLKHWKMHIFNLALPLPFPTPPPSFLLFIPWNITGWLIELVRLACHPAAFVLSLEFLAESMRKDRHLCARMIIICKSWPDIEIQEAVGTYEFSMLPWSRFADDGTLLHCSCKSTLFGILEKLPVNLNGDNNSAVNQSTEVPMRVAVVDTISEVQCLDKPEWIKNCSHAAASLATLVAFSRRSAKIKKSGWFLTNTMRHLLLKKICQKRGK